MKNRRAYALYTLLNAFFWGNIGVNVTYASRYFLSLGLTNAQAGLLLAASLLGAFLLQPAVTAVIERLHVSVQRVICAAAGLIVLFSAALVPLGKTPGAAVPLFTLSCMLLQLLPGFINALGMSAIQQGYLLNYGLSRGCGSVSFALVVRLVNLLIVRFGMDVLALCALVTALGTLLSAMLFPRLEGMQQARQAASGFGEFFRANRLFFVFLLGGCFLYLGHNALTNFMYQVALYKGDGNAQGTAVMLSALSELPVMFLFLKMLRRARCDFWLKISGIFCTLRLVLSLVLPGIGGLYAAQLMQTLGFALYTVSSVHYVGAAVEARDVVKGQAYLGAANNIGNLLASILAGVLVDGLGVRNMLLIVIAVSVLGTGLLFVSVRRPQQS